MKSGTISTSGAPGTAPSSARWPSAWSGGSSTGTRKTRASSSRWSRRSRCASARWRSPDGWTGWGRVISGAPREDERGRPPQLGVYQLAVLLGAFERFGLAEPGGAELVQVGKAAGVTLRAKVQRQGALAEDDEPGWAKDLVETVAAGMAGPVFEARVNPGCRTCPVASCCPGHPR